MPRATDAAAAPDPATVRMSVLVACASVLQVAETLLPNPLPGVRFGLANIVTIVALVQLGPASALELAVFRSLTSSLVMGTFLAPAFFLSLAGATASALVMTALYELSRRAGRFGLSLVGVSIAGSASHILAQVALVWLFFVRSPGVFWLLPWLFLAAVVTGALTGGIAIQALRRLSAADPEPATGVTLAPPGGPGGVLADGLLRRAAPAAKLAAALALGLVAVLVIRQWVYAALLLLLVLLAAAGRIRAARLAAGLRRLWPLLAVSLVMPMLFNNLGRVVFVLGSLRVTDAGLRDGAMFAGRLLLLLFIARLLALSTTPDELARGITRLLSPVRFLGARVPRVAQALSLSWTFFPVLWQRALEFVGRRRDRQGFLARAFHLPGDIVADLYRYSDRLAEEYNRPPPGRAE